MTGNSNGKFSRRQVLHAGAAYSLVAATKPFGAFGKQEGKPMNVIPSPRSFRLERGESCMIDSTTSIVVNNPELQPVASWLASWISRLASIELTESANGGTTIELLLDESLQPGMQTHGVRADGQQSDQEFHEVNIAPDSVRITGATAEAVFRGATTLLHLMANAAADGVAELDGVSVSDAPRFAWRGLSMDVVRTFHPVETVKQVLDLLALYKMNVLHLHLTDAEGWRFEVPDYPALTEVSGQTARDGRPGGSFSQEDYAGILAYASARFVTVVPEFDSPGHTASVLRAYPELGSPGMHAAPEAMRYLDPDLAGVWDLVGAVYAEMARVHPGARIHIGGDEAIALDEASFTRYMETALSMARATGKGIVAWQETARAGFAEGDLMQWWISPHLVEVVRRAAEDPENSPFANAFPDPAVGEAFIKLLLQAPEDLPKALAQGADVIVSRADKLYLDTKYLEPSADPEQEADHQRVGLPQRVYGNGTVQDSYDWDPATIDAGLPVDRIAGIEGAIWCETITDQRDLMMQLLPRLPGVAEKGWSDASEWADYHPRLAAQRHYWDAMDLNYFVSSVVWPEG
jgi:hexosaminidase